MKKIILIGGGGHAKVVIDAIRSTSEFEIAGIIDREIPIQTGVEGISVIGRDGDLQKIFASGIRSAFIAIGSVGSTKTRRELVRLLTEIGFDFPSIIHKKALVAASVQLGQGVLVTAGSILQPGTSVGEHAIINTGARIDHDCSIGPFVHIAPGVTLSGGVTIGKDAHVGTGSCVIEYKSIGEGSLIGAGSVVVTDIPDRCKAFGNPCKIKS